MAVKEKMLIKILIIDLDNVGDVVMASFLPRALKEMYRDSYIGVLVKEYSQDVIRYNPFINEIILFNPPWLGDLLDNRFTWFETAALIKKINAARFDLAIVINSDWRKAILTKLAKIPKRIGMDQKKAGYFLTETVNFEDDPQKHTVEYNIDLLRILGAKEVKDDLEVFVDENTRQWADNMLESQDVNKGNIVIGIHPGAGDPAKVWPREYFIKLINRLLEDKRIKILITESKGDAIADSIIAAIDNDRVKIAKNISILKMAALFKRCACVVSGDTGPMHLAVAVDTKVVAIFGPTNHGRYGPYGKGHVVVKKELSCSPCGDGSDCAKLDCLKNITVDEVFAGLKTLVEM